MQGHFYGEAFSRVGIEVVASGFEEQEYIHHKYMSEMVNGIQEKRNQKGGFTIATAVRISEESAGIACLPRVVH
jgi:aspartate/glutamate racemase